MACFYKEGNFGVKRDEKRAFHHWEEAAIGGHPRARLILGLFALNDGRNERAMKHFIIAANRCDSALKGLREVTERV